MSKKLESLSFPKILTYLLFLLPTTHRLSNNSFHLIASHKQQKYWVRVRNYIELGQLVAEQDEPG